MCYNQHWIYLLEIYIYYTTYNTIKSSTTMKLKLIIIYLYLQGLDVVHILESIKLICSHNFFE